MIRGAIDQISKEHVSGWFYSELESVRERVVLAFIDNHCIGSGRIEHFRRDLLSAGLGDGFLGFNISISVTNPGDLGRVTVRLQNSDLSLLQRGARIARDTGSMFDISHTPESVEWMRSRGWLDQSEFDLLKALYRIGVYDLSLRQTRSMERATGNPHGEPQLVANNMLSLIYMRDVKLVEQEASELAELVVPDNYEPVTGIWSPRREVVLVVEGAHRDGTWPMRPQSFLTGAVEHPCGPDRLLFVDLRGGIGSHIGRTGKKFRLFMTVRA